MAHIQKYYISDILKDVSGRLKTVSDMIFVDHRPVAKNEQMKELIVVSIASQLIEQNAFQQSFLSIELIVRDKPSGHADIARLQAMLDGVISQFPISTSRYSVISPRLTLEGSDGLGFTIWNIRASLIVNTTDSYK